MSEDKKIMLALFLCGAGSLLLTAVAIAGMVLAFSGSPVIGIPLWASASFMNTAVSVVAGGFLWGCIELGADKE